NMKRIQIALVLAIAVGAYLAGWWHSQPPPSALSARRVLYYRDPMHPSYHSDNPGIAPDCGMQLDAVYDGDEGFSPNHAPGFIRTVHISPEKQQLIGVRTTEARREPIRHVFRMPGRVVIDETRVYRVTGKVEGWVREIFSPTTGALV